MKTEYVSGFKVISVAFFTIFGFNCIPMTIPFFRSFRISYDRGAGGHKGVISVEKHIKTKKFVRIRVGIVPVFFGRMRKPKGGSAVQRHVLKKFGRGERCKIEKVLDKSSRAIEQILTEGYVSAMNEWN